MGIRKLNPTSPGQRGMTKSDFAEITTSTPEKSLLKPIRKTAGRNNTGRITCRHKGGGHKQAYRIIDFKREKFGVPAVVKTVEYDPNRNVRISLVVYADGEKRYILTPQDLKVGDTIVSGPEAEIQVGNALPLEAIPVGFTVHNIELTLGRGGQLARSAGASALVAAKEGEYVTIRLPSGEVRRVHKKCYATIGVVGNEDRMNTQLGKAGRARWRGIRPSVRGMAMNPVDHPLGGGEGAGKGRNPVTPWGQPCRGYKTRSKRKVSNNFIVSRRKK